MFNGSVVDAFKLPRICKAKFSAVSVVSLFCMI